MPIYITVDKRKSDGGIQISIEKKEADNSSHGYRIAGPKYDGNGINLLRHELTKRDAKEIDYYLDQIS